MALTKRQKEHRKFIASKEWKAIKENLFKIRGKECEICGAKNVQVHHKHYDKPYGEEQPEDLIILCSRHHRKAHGIIKESEKEREIRELHEEMWNVPGCYRMEYEDKPVHKKYKKKKRKSKKRKTKRCCGNCGYFVRFKNDENSTGLCEKYDSRTGVESGKRCRYFKKKQYERKKFDHKIILRKS